MPDKWSAKDERQYEHIKHSVRQRGKSTDRASEIAARTVNKQRRLEGRTPTSSEGRTPTSSTMGIGNPNSPLRERSRQELYNRARQLKIHGRSAMNKEQLIRAIRRR